MTHDILLSSCPRLLGIIDELGLYPEEKTRLEPDHLFELMRHDVSIEPLLKPGQRDAKHFSDFVHGGDSDLAQQVTSRLTTLFIEENLKTRTDQATTTTGLFTRTARNCQRQARRRRNNSFGISKCSISANYRSSSRAIWEFYLACRLNWITVMSNRNQAQQQRLYLESLLTEHRRRSRSGAVATTVSDTGQIVTPLDAAHHDLTRLQAERRTLLTVYTPQHPDVLKKDQEIKVQQTFVDGLKAVTRYHRAPRAQHQQCTRRR